MFSKHKEKKPDTETAAADAPAPLSESAPSAGAAPAAEAAAPAAASVAPAQPSPEATELAAVKERYARLMADFDNFRKRQTREREELIKRANEDLLGDVLPIVDHIELALGKTPDLANPFVAGVKMVYDQFLALLERYGVTPIDAKGQPFNPDWHEALSQMNSATVPANEVIDQFRRGWCLAGRLLRPAQVIVSAGTPDDDQAAAENASVSD
jgi:molecular chaperone GrpE